jgi:predicted RNase H-like HicB family nuclease
MGNISKKISRKRVKVLQYNAVFQEEKEGGFSVWVPALPGCCSQGETFEEAVENIKEAIELYLESKPEILEFGDEKKEKQFLVPIKISYV